MSYKQKRRTVGGISYINRWVKYSLCLANFLFLLVGSIFLVFGAIALVESSDILAKSTVSVVHWLLNLTVICIGVGVVTLFVSFSGFMGSLRENRCLLRFYYTFVSLLFFAEVIFCVLFFVYRDSAIRKLEDLIKMTFVIQYREAGFEDTTNFMDFIQKELNCCGPKSYLDWTANRYFSCTSNNTSSEACGVPYSCCRHMNNINENVINTSCGFGVQNSSDRLTSPSVWTTGCVQALVDFVETNIVFVACIIIGVALLQLLAIFLAKTLHTQISDQLRLLRQQESVNF